MEALGLKESSRKSMVQVQVWSHLHSKVFGLHVDFLLHLSGEGLFELVVDLVQVCGITPGF